jgi:hypothetical protein
MVSGTSAGAEIQQYFEGVFKNTVLPIFRSSAPKSRVPNGRDAWTLQDQHGKQYQGKVVVAATGVLHHPNYPQIKGLEEFGGHDSQCALGSFCTAGRQEDRRHRHGINGRANCLGTGVACQGATFSAHGPMDFSGRESSFPAKQRAEFRSNRDLLVYPAAQT